MTAICTDVKLSQYFELRTSIEVHRDIFIFVLDLVYICFKGIKQLRVFANIESGVRDHKV